jgi:predicted dehydrogenase
VSSPFRYAIVGRGWRAQFFLRLAALMPDRFAVTAVVTRDDAGAAEVAERWHVPAHTDLSAIGRPDFVISSVPWDTNPGIIEALVDAGRPVLSETPPAPDIEAMRALWSSVGASGLVQVAEQYLLLPDHAARLALIHEAVIGEPTSAQVSSTHMYHAVSMIRGFLGVGFEPATVNGHAFTAPLADPMTPAGWTGDATPKPATTTIATIDFGGRMGLYDFTENQWWNPLRTWRILVRGTLGELVDDTVVRLADARTPIRSTLHRRQLGRDLNLEGADLDHISFDGRVVYRNPYAGARLSDEDIAIASILERTGAWARDGAPAPYPLARASQDHLIALAVEESTRTGHPVTTGIELWAT